MEKKVRLLGIALIILSCSSSEYEASRIDKPVPIENRTERFWTQGWLEVKENRSTSSSNLISLPFILSHTNDSLKVSNPPVLIMSGGPGNSSLHMANGIVNSPWGKKHDVLVLEQRGTIHSIPSLICPEIDSVRIFGRETGKSGDDLDSLVLLGTKQCYDRLSKIAELDSYNTLESVTDIEDLRIALGLEKLILYGMSYSCNLMLTYAQKYPDNVAAMVLTPPFHIKQTMMRRPIKILIAH